MAISVVFDLMVIFYTISAFLKMEEEGNRLPNNPVEKACISNKEDGIYCSLAGKSYVLLKDNSGQLMRFGTNIT